MRAPRRDRGAFLVEAVVACGFAVLVLGTLGAEVHRQRLELSRTRGEARARSALRSAYERLRAGTLATPAAGKAIALDGDSTVSVTVERADPIDAALAAGGVVAVRLRARWRDFDGKPRTREVTTLVPGGGP